MRTIIWLLVFYLLTMGGVMDSNAYAQGEGEEAIFAGGCFWCMESDFQDLPGVHSVVSGYIGGKGDNPKYEDYVEKGHIEAVQITYNPGQINYQELLDLLWLRIDPVDGGGQFCDRGYAHSTAIFYINEQQKDLAAKSKQALDDSGKLEQPVATQIIKATKFYPAEDYHQDYYKNNSIRYKLYRFNCGRDKRLKQLWGKVPCKDIKKNSMKYNKPDKDVLRENLTPLQYKVTQNDATEPPFKNEYWDNKRAGIYVDIVSGEPLFSSLDKFNSGTGWPSFTKQLEGNNIIETEDRSWGSVRTEVRSKYADSHLGHVFEDGPKPTGLRYCLNSSSLRFIAVENLAKEGYGEYEKLFK